MRGKKKSEFQRRRANWRVWARWKMRVRKRQTHRRAHDIRSHKQNKKKSQGKKQNKKRNKNRRKKIKVSTSQWSHGSSFIV